LSYVPCAVACVSSYGEKVYTRNPQARWKTCYDCCMNSGSRMRAFSASFTLFVFLCAVAFFVFRYYPVAAQYMRDAFYIATICVIALLTVVFHQSLLISMSARSLARNM